MSLVSYNGWTASPDPAAIGIVPIGFPGRPNVCPPGVKSGDVATVLRYVAEQFHKRVEPLGEGCWGYAYRQNRNANNLSCHSSGTAIDLNAPRHPNGKAGTFTKAQVATIRRILTEVDGAVRWGGDFTGTPDEMHFEIVANAAALRTVARKLTTPASPPIPEGRPLTNAELVKAVAAEVRKQLLPDLLRLAQYLRGAENSVFNNAHTDLPPAKDCAS